MNLNFQTEEPTNKSLRSLEISFDVQDQSFIVLNDLSNDGGLDNSARFYKGENGKPEQFLFWTDRKITDPMIAKYVFTEFVAQKDGATTANDQALLPNIVEPPVDNQRVQRGPKLRRPKKPRKTKRFSYQHNTTTLLESMNKSEPVTNHYGILRLENDNDCVDSYGIELLEGNDLTNIAQENHAKSLTLTPFGVSKLAWLNAEGAFVKGNYQYKYDMLEKGFYEVCEASEYGCTIYCYGSQLKGYYTLDFANGQIKWVQPLDQHDDGTECCDPDCDFDY